MIIACGIGALGSHCVQFLRNVDMPIKAIDFDKVETKNIQSQFHSKSGVGKNKTSAIQQLMQFLYGKKLDIIPHKITSDNVKELLGGAKLVIDCLDNGEGRRIIQAFVRKNGIACLHGALAADGAFGRVIWDEDFVIDDETVGTPTCENGIHLPFIGITSAYLAQAAKVYLETGKKIGFQIHSGGTFRV